MGGNGRQASCVARKGGEEGRIGLIQTLQQPEGRRLGDEEIVIVRKIPGAMRGDADTGRKPCSHQIEQHFGLVAIQRKSCGISRNDRRGSGIDVLDVEKGVGEGDGKLVDLAAVSHVAEVDEPPDLAAIDDEIVVVGILMQHGASQPCKPWQDAFFVTSVDAPHEAAMFGCDILDPWLQRHHLVEVPQEAGAMRGGMAEAPHRMGEASQKAAEARKQRGGLRRGGEQLPGQIGEQADRVRSAAGFPLGHVAPGAAWHQARQAKRGFNRLKMAQGGILQIEQRAILGGIGDLEDKPPLRRLHQEVLVALADQLAQHALQAIVAPQEAGGLLGREAGLGLFEDGNPVHEACPGLGNGGRSCLVPHRHRACRDCRRLCP